MDVERFNRLVREAEEAKRDRDRAAGAYEQAMKEIKEECGCATLKEAKATLAKLDKELEREDKAFDDAMDAFEEAKGEQARRAPEEG